MNKHRDFVPHLDRARQVAEELYRRYPQQVSRMSAEQFVDEVARQTDIILTNEYKRWNPSATTTWRDRPRGCCTGSCTNTCTVSSADRARIDGSRSPRPASLVKPPAATVPQAMEGLAQSVGIPWSPVHCGPGKVIPLERSGSPTPCH